MNRRDFIKRTAAATSLVGMGLSLSSFDVAESTHLTILHTNDVHSYIDPFPPTHPRNPNMGGVARRSTLIEGIRKENPNVLLLDAGDIFQGTPYFNYYGGELELKLMSMMGYDLATMGNHDFDNGIEGFYKQLPNAKFDIVSANYDFSKTILDGIVKPYKIINKAGLKIGIFGLGVELAGLVDKRNYKETVYLDPIAITQNVVADLKKQNCDMIICLSHLGYNYSNDPLKVSDLILASKTKDIDLIIGGHTHTFLDKPTVVKNLEGIDTIINQVGCYGLNLGRLDFYFKKGKTSGFHGKSISV